MNTAHWFKRDIYYYGEVTKLWLEFQSKDGTKINKNDQIKHMT